MSSKIKDIGKTTTFNFYLNNIKIDKKIIFRYSYLLHWIYEEIWKNE